MSSLYKSEHVAIYCKSNEVFTNTWVWCRPSYGYFLCYVWFV